MKRKLELQTIIVLLCVLGVAAAWIGLQVTKDSLGLWTESAELHFTSPDLLGLGVRAELRCAGATIGHVRKIMPSLGPDGQAQFLVIAGVQHTYADWKFLPVGVVRAGVVESALTSSSILLELSNAPTAVQAHNPKVAPVAVLPLEKEHSENDFSEIIAQYRKLGDQIDVTVRQFTEPQNGRAQSVLQEFSESIPAAAATLKEVEAITANLQLQISPNGKIDQTLTSLNASLDRLEGLTTIATTTVSNLNGQVDTSLGKMNSLMDETTGTMSALHLKIDGFGDTFFGRMLIAKPGEAPAPAASPTPKKPR